MRAYQKVFVGGLVMSGKNVLWRLLDGHVKVKTNYLHSNITFFPLSPACKKYFLRRRKRSDESVLSEIPKFDLVYSPHEKAKVTIGDFFYALHCFSGYKELLSWAKAGVVFINAKEGHYIRVPVNYSIEQFVSQIEQSLFCGDIFVSENELANIICNAYLMGAEANKQNITVEQCQYFVDTLPVGIEPLETVAKKLPDSKLIIMERDLESLIFANTIRMTGLLPEKNIEGKFRKMLNWQQNFAKRIREFYTRSKRLNEASNNVMIVKFEEMIVDTETVMRRVAKFLELEYDPIFEVITVDGREIEFGSSGVLGEVNDDPNSFLSRQDLELLRFSYYGMDRSWLKNPRKFWLIVRYFQSKFGI